MLFYRTTVHMYVTCVTPSLHAGLGVSHWVKQLNIRLGLLSASAVIHNAADATSHMCDVGCACHRILPALHLCVLLVGHCLACLHVCVQSTLHWLQRRQHTR